jgi:hypothetical protein
MRQKPPHNHFTRHFRDCISNEKGRSPRSVMLRLLLLLSLLLVTLACSAQYRGEGLLFGGVGNQCVQGCRARSSEVSRTCGFRGPQEDVWGLCSPQQLANNRRECCWVLPGVLACCCGDSDHGLRRGGGGEAQLMKGLVVGS